MGLIHNVRDNCTSAMHFFRLEPTRQQVPLILLVMCRSSLGKVCFIEVVLNISVQRIQLQKWRVK